VPVKVRKTFGASRQNLRVFPSTKMAEKLDKKWHMISYCMKDDGFFEFDVALSWNCLVC